METFVEQKNNSVDGKLANEKNSNFCKMFYGRSDDKIKTRNLLKCLRIEKVKDFNLLPALSNFIPSRL